MRSKMGSRRAPWRCLGGLGPLWSSPGAPGWSWAPLGALRAPLGAVLGAPGPLLGLPGRAWGSFGPPGELLLEPFGATVEGSLAKSREPRNSLTAQHFLRFSEALKSLRNRSQARLGASGGFLGPLGAVLSLSGALHGPSAWLLGRPWVAPDRSQLTGPRGTQVKPCPKSV